MLLYYRLNGIIGAKVKHGTYSSLIVDIGQATNARCRTFRKIMDKTNGQNCLGIVTETELKANGRHYSGR